MGSFIREYEVYYNPRLYRPCWSSLSAAGSPDRNFSGAPPISRVALPDELRHERKQRQDERCADDIAEHMRADGDDAERDACREDRPQEKQRPRDVAMQPVTARRV